MPIKDRGFASLNPIDRRRIASLGGKAAHKAGTAHRWTSDEARTYGATGGRTKRQVVDVPPTPAQGWPAFHAEELIGDLIRDGEL